MKQEYELYKKPLTKQQYFDRWSPEERLAVKYKTDVIYNNYLVKCEVFNRDGFRCQNQECETPESPLTFHHIKKKSNGGKDSSRNGVTICDRCHKNFHRGKKPLVYGDCETLPPHIRGHTYWEHIDDEYDWKKHKKEMRVFRKQYMREHRVRYLNWEQLYVLMMWLYGW